MGAIGCAKQAPVLVVCESLTQQFCLLVSAIDQCVQIDRYVRVFAYSAIGNPRK